MDRRVPSQLTQPSLGIGRAVALPGTAAPGMVVPGPDPDVVRLEHSSGFLDVRVSVGGGGADVRAAVVRTARKHFDGEVMT